MKLEAALLATLSLINREERAKRKANSKFFVNMSDFFASIHNSALLDLLLITKYF
jgi:hypothetical protein